MKMRIFFHCIFFSILLVSCNQQATTDEVKDEYVAIDTPKEEAVPQIIFLVRHAEKANDGTKDPDLNEVGKERAQKLAVMLQNAEIQGIYSSPYKRTRQTGQVLADSLGLTIQEYNPSKPEEVKQAIESAEGQNLLIVGHSNTTPNVVNYLLGEEKYPQLTEKEYDKLFVLVKGTEKYSCTVLSF